MVSQTPSRVADLYAGEPLIVALAADSAPTQVEITGRFGAMDWQQSVACPAGRPQAASMHCGRDARSTTAWDAWPVQRTGTGQAGGAEAGTRTPAGQSIHQPGGGRAYPAPSDRCGAEVRAMPVRLPAGWSAARYSAGCRGLPPAPLFLVLGLAGLALAGVLRRRWR